MPLDTFSMLVGSIALGLLVDDTVHYFHNFKKHYDQTTDVQRSIEKTSQEVSRPVIITSIVLVSGFWVYTRSQLSNVAHFGSIMTIVIILGLLIDLIFTPALFTLRHLHVGKRATDRSRVSGRLSSASKDGTYCPVSYQRSEE
jgi:predicted RND superfamily exporter protein